MEADRQWHRLGREIFDRGLDFERSIAQAVRDLDRMRERKLRHPCGVTPQFKPAGDEMRILPDHSPGIGEQNQAVNR